MKSGILPHTSKKFIVLQVKRISPRSSCPVKIVCPRENSSHIVHAWRSREDETDSNNSSKQTANFDELHKGDASALPHFVPHSLNPYIRTGPDVPEADLNHMSSPRAAASSHTNEPQAPGSPSPHPSVGVQRWGVAHTGAPSGLNSSSSHALPRSDQRQQQLGKQGTSSASTPTLRALQKHAIEVVRLGKPDEIEQGTPSIEDLLQLQPAVRQHGTDFQQEEDGGLSKAPQSWTPVRVGPDVPEVDLQSGKTIVDEAGFSDLIEGSHMSKRPSFSARNTLDTDFLSLHPNELRSKPGKQAARPAAADGVTGLDPAPKNGVRGEGGQKVPGMPSAQTQFEEARLLRAIALLYRPPPADDSEGDASSNVSKGMRKPIDQGQSDDAQPKAGLGMEGFAESQETLAAAAFVRDIQNLTQDERPRKSRYPRPASPTDKGGLSVGLMLGETEVPSGSAQWCGTDEEQASPGPPSVTSVRPSATPDSPVAADALAGSWGEVMQQVQESARSGFVDDAVDTGRTNHKV